MQESKCSKCIYENKQNLNVKSKKIWSGHKKNRMALGKAPAKTTKAATQFFAKRVKLQYVQNLVIINIYPLPIWGYFFTTKYRRTIL